MSTEPEYQEPIVEYHELRAEHATVEKVEQASMHVTVDANCAVATLLSKPCATSIHDAAIAIEQPDMHVHVDLQPVGIGLASFGVCVAIAAGVIAKALARR